MKARREPLPARRRSWTRKAKIADAAGDPQTFYLSVSEYPDGRPGEVWLEVSKEGTFTRGMAGALARLASVSLQCGVPVAEVVRSLKGLDFPPRGVVLTEGGPVPSCTSVPDWVARELEAAYPEGDLT